jgi:hypothetical protein
MYLPNNNYLVQGEHLLTNGKKKDDVFLITFPFSLTITIMD